MKYYLAIDLGATSGRHIVGYKEKDQIKLVEIYRFRTEMDNSPNGLIWDINRLFKEIKKGIKIAFKKFQEIESISIDTWGVDYVLMNGDKEIMPCLAYRNDRCQNGAFFVHKTIPFEELYKRNGIQFANFNTIYQLYDDMLTGRLETATDYLMLPSYFSYKLTGVKSHEYTDESTTGLLNPYTRDYDFSLIDELKLPRKLFGKIEQPGFVLGDLLPEIQHQVGGNAKVILCASHDTGSAFEAVETPEDAIFLSSGTWSLLGIKPKEPIVNEESFKNNYTNEGGVGYIRFLKNIVGMWIANSVRNETMFTIDFINKHIKESKYNVTFDIDDPSLVAPKSMKTAVEKLLQKCPPQNNLELFSSIYNSMALSYKKAIEGLEAITNKKYHSIYIVGGGAKNTYLNNLIEKYTNLKVVAMPIEATALGNIKIQMKTGGEL